MDKDTRLKASLLTSHADQYREEVLRFLMLAGEEYATTLSEAIHDGCQSEEPAKRIFSMLAEIGYCTLLAGAVEEVPAE